LKFYVYESFKMLGYIISDKEKIKVKWHEIINFNVLCKTNLNIFVVKNDKALYKNDIIFNASKYGHVEILEWYKKSGYKFKYDKNYIYVASKNGHVEVLEWFKKSGYKFKYYKNSIYVASINNHIQILEWFKNSGYKFKYDESLINRASKYGQVEVLKWFKKSGYKLKYDKKVITSFDTYYFNFYVLKFCVENINLKKLIKWINYESKSIKPLKFKTKNNYIKGYNKN
jgi:hypothetical protein